MLAGIVGIGKMGLLHMSILSTITGVKVVGVCDKSKIISKFAKKALKEFVIVDSIEKLKDMSLDVVYITTSIPSHFKVIENVYSNRIAPNLFVEKTLAFSLDQAKKICSLADGSNGKNMVGYERRYAVTFNKAYDLIQHGDIGNVTSFKAYSYSSDFLNVDVEKGTKASTARGGLLRDLCSHAIDLSIWFFGDLRVISKEQRRSNDNPIFQESIGFNVIGQDGVNGIIDASWCKAGYRLPEIGLEIVGKKGSLRVNDDQLILKSNLGASTFYRLNLRDNVDFLLGAPEYYRESKNFIGSIINDTVAEPNFKTALKTEQIIDQVNGMM